MADLTLPVDRPVRDHDPVLDPDGYRRFLLDLLGAEDPGVVAAATADRMREVVRLAGPRLRDRPEPGEWSAIECLGHLLDGEIVLSGRYRWIAAEDEPDIVGYDQDHWMDRLGHRDDDPEALIALFAGLRAANIRLWERATAADHARIGVHRERGPESWDLTRRLSAGHDLFHLAQAERAFGHR